MFTRADLVSCGYKKYIDESCKAKVTLMDLSTVENMENFFDRLYNTQQILIVPYPY